MKSVLLWSGVVLLNLFGMLVLNRRRLRRQESASMESAFISAALCTLIVLAAAVVSDRNFSMYLPIAIVTVGGASLLTSWCCLIVSERWSARRRQQALNRYSGGQ